MCLDGKYYFEIMYREVPYELTVGRQPRMCPPPIVNSTLLYTKSIRKSISPTKIILNPCTYNFYRNVWVSIKPMV